MSEMSEIPVVHVRYHFEEDSWWADSPDIEGYSAAADSFDEVRAQVREGMPFFLGEAAAIVEEGVPDQFPFGDAAVATIHITGAFSGSLLRGHAVDVDVQVGASPVEQTVAV
jgi:predicted RNase H-like HicB family nuclease